MSVVIFASSYFHTSPYFPVSVPHVGGKNKETETMAISFEPVQLQYSELRESEQPYTVGEPIHLLLGKNILSTNKRTESTCTMRWAHYSRYNGTGKVKMDSSHFGEELCEIVMNITRGVSILVFFLTKYKFTYFLILSTDTT